MNESILTTIKKMLGPEEAYDHFDSDIIVHINSAFTNLTRFGVGPEEGFYITDKTAKWTEFLDPSSKMHHLVKSYIHLKVKVVFDPPTSSYVLNAMKDDIKELEWRLTDLAEEEKSQKNINSIG